MTYVGYSLSLNHQYSLVSNSGPRISGGSDTTVSASLALIAALCMNPELQRKAQAEIDQVTEGLRLPTCDDMEKLPYCQALVKELNRWHTVLPLGRLLSELRGSAIDPKYFSRTTHFD